MLWLWSTTVAHAACPLSAADVEEAARRSAEAIADDDAPTHRKVWTALVRDLHCLGDELPRSAWARLELDEAIVRYAEGGAWEGPLASARRADPTIELPPFLARTPPSTELPSASGALRGPTTVDGATVRGPVKLAGPHVVQAYSGMRWTTWYVEDGPFPADALETGTPAPEPTGPTPRASDDSTWASAGLVGGWAETSDRLDGRPDDGLVRGGAGGPTAFGQLSLGSSLAVVGEGTLWLGDGVLPSLQAGVGAGTPTVTAWAGAALVTVRWGPGEARSTWWLPQPQVGVNARASGPGRPLDGAIRGGWWPGTWNVAGRLGVGVSELSFGQLRVGTRVDVLGTSFVQDTTGVGASATRWSGGLEVGVSTP